MRIGGGLCAQHVEKALWGQTDLYQDAALWHYTFISLLFPFPPKGVLNFVQYKFSHLAPKERQTMFELSKMFLLCLNYWKLETPTQYRQRTQKDDGTAYKVDYTRCVFVLLLKKAGTCFYLVDFCVGCWYQCFSLWLPGGCATAMSLRVTTACRAMKPLRCSAAACSSPSSLWPDASSWRSSEWRRTNCYQRNAHSSSHTFPSKGRLWLLK